MPVLKENTIRVELKKELQKNVHLILSKKKPQLLERRWLAKCC